MNILHICIYMYAYIHIYKCMNIIMYIYILIHRSCTYVHDELSQKDFYRCFICNSQRYVQEMDTNVPAVGIVYMYIYIYIYIYVYTYEYIYIYLHTYDSSTPAIGNICKYILLALFKFT
jgi:hypothetical protein